MTVDWPAGCECRGAAVGLRQRLSALVKLVNEESSERRPGRELVLARLVELLLIEALRSKPDDDAPPALPPMEYLLAWRMALAKDLLRRADGIGLAEVAERVGYGSASTFSTAFSRYVGQSPSRYTRGQL